MLAIADHMEELVSGLQGPPGIPGRGRPGRPGPPGRIGHTGTHVRVCLNKNVGLHVLKKRVYPMLSCFEMSCPLWEI